MFDIGFAELVLLSVIGMVVIGPERLPGVVRSVGKTMGKARRFITGLQNQIEQELKLDELNKKIMDETKDMDFTQPIIQPTKHDQDHDPLTDAPSAVGADLPSPPDLGSSASPSIEQATDVDESPKS